MVTARVGSPLTWKVSAMRDFDRGPALTNVARSVPVADDDDSGAGAGTRLLSFAPLESCAFDEQAASAAAAVAPVTNLRRFTAERPVASRRSWSHGSASKAG